MSSNPSDATRSRGLHRFKEARERRCGRCGCDISARHGNAIYCEGCTDRKSKPFVHSVRLDRETHERLLLAVNRSKQKRIQPILEGIIKAGLKGGGHAG
jgi:hypothetical protein